MHSFTSLLFIHFHYALLLFFLEGGGLGLWGSERLSRLYSAFRVSGLGWV